MLVIDDEPAILRSTRLLLEISGDTCACAQSAEEGLALARERPPDVVLQDLQMPGLDIEAHLARLRSDVATRQAAIVVFSACIDLDAVVVGRALDHDERVEKPFTLPSLLDAIGRAVERRQGMAALPAAHLPNVQERSLASRRRSGEHLHHG